MIEANAAAAWAEKVDRADRAYFEGIARIRLLEDAVKAAPESFVEWLLTKERYEQDEIFALLRIIDRQFRKGGASHRCFALLDAKRRVG